MCSNQLLWRKCVRAHCLLRQCERVDRVLSVSVASGDDDDDNDAVVVDGDGYL